MSKYFYHPAGDYAVNYINGTIPPNSYNSPRSYNTHGYGKIDWALPYKQPIYSMTDGYITTIKRCVQNRDGCDGYAVCIKSDRKAYCGLTNDYRTVYMNYIEMGGLSDRLANLLGVSEGEDTWVDNAGVTKTYAIDMQKINQGEIIGYAIGGRNYSNLHTDWTFADRWGSGQGAPQPNFNNPSTIPQIKYSDLPSDFNVDMTKTPPRISFKGKELGLDGCVINEALQPISYYPVYPSYIYIVVLQLPEEKSETKIDTKDKININKNVYLNTKGTEDDINAAEAYFSKVIPETFLGPYPTKLSAFKNDNDFLGLRSVIDTCGHEFGGWPFAAISYSKLFRATIIGNYDVYTQSDNATTLFDWVYNVHHNLPAWTGEWSINDGTHYAQECSLEFAQAVYKNLKYPDIYGVSLHTGTRNFKNAIIKAINGISLVNFSTYWLGGTPPFAVLFDLERDIDEGTSGTPRSGTYLMYRPDNSFRQINPLVKEW